MTFTFNGETVSIPADWNLHVQSWNDGYQVSVMRAGRLLPLSEALILKEMIITTSRPVNKTPTDGDGR